MMNKQNDAQRSASVKSPVNRRVWIALGALCIASFLGTSPSFRSYLI